MLHETTEKTPRLRKTILVNALDSVSSRTIDVLVLPGTAPLSACRSRAKSGPPSVRKRPSGTLQMRRCGQRDVQNSITQEKGCQTYVRIGVLFPNMLRFLRISRLAVIDTVEVEFEPGVHVR